MASSPIKVRPADRTLELGGVWERAWFSVPSTVNEERVQFAADKYMRKFGNWLEAKGFTVLAMRKPVAEPNKDLRALWAKESMDGPDRRRYVIWAWCRRRPIDVVMWVPDSAVAQMQGLGMRELTASERRRLSTDKIF